MPMFPGYVFVLLDFEVVHPSCFTRMKNVYGLVSFGEYPAEVPLSVINEVKEQEKIFSMNLSLMNNSCLAKNTSPCRRFKAWTSLCRLCV